MKSKLGKDRDYLPKKEPRAGGCQIVTPEKSVLTHSTWKSNNHCVPIIQSPIYQILALFFPTRNTIDFLIFPLC